MNDKTFAKMDRRELKEYIFKLQDLIKQEQEKGKDIDTILDETDIFDPFENLLPDNEFPIFVITVLNGFQSDVIIDNILDVIEKTNKGQKN